MQEEPDTETVETTETEPTPEEVRRVMSAMGRKAQAKHPGLKDNLLAGRTPPSKPECTCGMPYQKLGRTKSGRNPGRIMWRRKHTKDCPVGVWMQKHYPNQGKNQGKRIRQ